VLDAPGEIDFTSYVCGTGVGRLIAELRGDTIVGPVWVGYTGLYAGYAATQNATAFVFARCSFDASGAAGVMGMRAAYQVGTTVTQGDAFPLATNTAGIEVENSVFDYFDLSAGTTYGFGVYFAQMPDNGTDPDDYCSMVVQIFSR
jgi:hypothetical protein